MKSLPDNTQGKQVTALVLVGTIANVKTENLKKKGIACKSIDAMVFTFGVTRSFSSLFFSVNWKIDGSN